MESLLTLVHAAQEVQSNHFYDFLQPELIKHGYSAVYKKKTMEIYTGNSYAIDGCATFFKKDKFGLVKKYEVSYAGVLLVISITLENPWLGLIERVFSCRPAAETVNAQELWYAAESTGL